MEARIQGSGLLTEGTSGPILARDAGRGCWRLVARRIPGYLVGRRVQVIGVPA